MTQIGGGGGAFEHHLFPGAGNMIKLKFKMSNAQWVSRGDVEVSN